jgi:ribonuclease P protein component
LTVRAKSSHQHLVHDAGEASATIFEEAMGEAPLPAEQPPPGQAARVPPPNVHARRTSHRRRPSPQGPSSSVRLIESIRDRATFVRLRQAGRRAHRGPVRVTWVPATEGGEITRVAYAVGRAVGGAVVRNRVRRRLRSAVADVEPQLRAGAYLFGAGPEAATIPYRELKAAVSDVVRAVTGSEDRAASRDR